MSTTALRGPRVFFTRAGTRALEFAGWLDRRGFSSLIDVTGEQVSVLGQSLSQVRLNDLVSEWERETVAAMLRPATLCARCDQVPATVPGNCGDSYCSDCGRKVGLL